VNHGNLIKPSFLDTDKFLSALKTFVLLRDVGPLPKLILSKTLGRGDHVLKKETAVFADP
jgi:hypothetical protein